MAANALFANDTGPVPLTLGVTGHRDPPDAERSAIEAQLKALFEDLEQRYPDTPLRLISPLADGGDRIAARVARDRGIELVVPLPFPAEEYETRNKSDKPEQIGQAQIKRLGTNRTSRNKSRNKSDRHKSRGC